MSEPTTLAYRVTRIENEHYELEREMHDALKEVHLKLDRLMVAIVGGLLTLSISLVVVAATILASGGT